MDRIHRLWILFGAGDKARYVPVRSLVQNLGKSRASSLLAPHILSGCNVTSKLGTKAAVIKQIDSTLSLCGQSQPAKAGILQRSEL